MSLKNTIHYRVRLLNYFKCCWAARRRMCFVWNMGRRSRLHFFGSLLVIFTTEHFISRGLLLRVKQLSGTMFCHTTDLKVIG
jgi:hypothetical protein